MSANYPLSSKLLTDLDGDNQKDEVLYQIRPIDDFYEGLLKITSAKGKVLWENSFPIDAGELSEWLSTMGIY